MHLSYHLGTLTLENIRAAYVICQNLDPQRYRSFQRTDLDFIICSDHPHCEI